MDLSFTASNYIQGQQLPNARHDKCLISGAKQQAEPDLEGKAGDEGQQPCGQIDGSVGVAAQHALDDGAQVLRSLCRPGLHAARHALKHCMSSQICEVSGRLGARLTCCMHPGLVGLLESHQMPGTV